MVLIASPNIEQRLTQWYTISHIPQAQTDTEIYSDLMSEILFIEMTCSPFL